jgi:hypothetical protein
MNLYVLVVDVENVPPGCTSSSILNFTSERVETVTLLELHIIIWEEISLFSRQPSLLNIC